MGDKKERDMKDLFRGVVLVIDDEIGIKGANINKIVDQLCKKNIPVIKRKKLPCDEEIKHFKNLSFIILDWDLKSKTTEVEGVTTPRKLNRAAVARNIRFINYCNKDFLCPIFVFTSHHDVAERDLETNDIKFDPTSNVFVCRKKDLTRNNSVFKKIEEWLKNNPSMYVLKEWNTEYQKSRGKLFSDFQEMSPDWPRILWRNYSNDSVDPSQGLGRVILSHLQARMDPFDFSEDILGGYSNEKEQKESSSQKETQQQTSPKNATEEELRKVIEGYTVLDKSETLHGIAPGDIFKRKGPGKYYINIRPACDLIQRNDKRKKIDLYLLKGKVDNKTDYDEKGFNKYGAFHDKHHEHTVFPLGNKIVVFKFKELEIQSWEDMKESRIARLLPPYITAIQQRYALYIQRQGLPRIPFDALPPKNKNS